MRIPDPKANTTTEAYLAYKAGYLEESELKPKLYEPYLHFDAWLAYWAGLTTDYPNKGLGKNLIPVSTYDASENRTYMVENFTLKAGTYTASFNLDSFSLGSNTDFEFRLALRDEGNVGHNIVLIKPDSSTTTGRKTYTFYIEYNTSVSVWPALYIIETAYNNGARIKISNLQIEAGSTATSYEPYAKTPEMLTDEEALVAYLSGVTDTYPEEIKDPYDVRIVGYLKYLVSARWGRPEYPVNNEEFYLSTMKPPVVPSGDTPSSDIEMDDTAEAPFIDLKMYGDTSQNAYTGKNLFNVYGVGGTSLGDNLVSYTVENEELTITQVGTNGNGYVWVRLDKDKFLGKELTLSVGEVTSYDGSTGPRIRFTDQSGANIPDVSFTILPDREPTKTFSVPSELPSGVTELRLYIYVNNSNVAGQVGATSKYTKLQIEVGSTATSYEPYVGGVPAPNPDYPQNVQTVTGRQMVTVIGKNMLDSLNGYVDGYINSSGEIGAGGGTNALFDYIAVSPSSNYTLSQQGANVTNAGIAYFDANKNFLSREQTYGFSSQTYSTPEGCSYVRVWVYKSGEINQSIIENAQLQFEQGSTATTYKPYQSQSYEINLGKNLFNTMNYNGNVTITSLNSFEANRDTARTVNIYFSPRLPAGTYTLSYDVSKNSINTYGIACSVYVVNGSSTSSLVSVPRTDGHIEFTFTSPTEVDRLYFYINQNMPSGSTASVSNIQVEVGSSATSFAPYFEPIELCKLGDYQDYISRDEDGDWYFYRNVQHLSLPVSSMDSDSGNYPGWTSPSVTNILTDTLPDGNYPLVENTSVLCSCLGSGGDLISKVRWNKNIPKLYLSRTSSEYYQLSYSEWIAQYPNLVFELYYGIVKNATKTIIANPELISQLDALMEGGSYEGKTYIKVTATDPNLPGLLYVEAGKYD